ncbi:hypothetical protein LZ023_16140 [Pseudomonas silvicola]|nr:hypothetical protein LZ023_16140 [Pseudomonas silvicola]
MTTEQETIGIAEDSDEERKHQDDFLGPQARCLGSWLHSSFDGKTEWQVMTSVGMATDVEKSPLVEEISRAGSPLNDLYFIGMENLELWIDGQLAGLCRYRNVKPDANEDADDGALHLYVVLEAVFIRPRYHSLGFGELVSEALAEQIDAGILTCLHKERPFKGQVGLTLFADFNSEQGERFFDHLHDVIFKRMEAMSDSLGVSIDVETDAGY